MYKDLRIEGTEYLARSGNAENSKKHLNDFNGRTDVPLNLDLYVLGEQE